MNKWNNIIGFMSYFVNNSLTKLEGTFLGHRVYSRKLNPSFWRIYVAPKLEKFETKIKKIFETLLLGKASKIKAFERNSLSKKNERRFVQLIPFENSPIAIERIFVLNFMRADSIECNSKERKIIGNVSNVVSFSYALLPTISTRDPVFNSILTA